VSTKVFDSFLSAKPTFIFWGKLVGWQASEGFMCQIKVGNRSFPDWGRPEAAKKCQKYSSFWGRKTRRLKVRFCDEAINNFYFGF
jgi:hypothetical protein